MTIINLELFDVRGIDFMGLFMSSHGMKYTLVVVDYDSKLAKTITLPNNKGRCVKTFLKKRHFSRDLVSPKQLLVMVAHTSLIISFKPF